MNNALTWLFGLDELEFGADNVAVGFARPLPTWAWIAMVLAVLALAAWGYRKLEGNRKGRGVMAGVRAALLLLLIAVVLGPQLIRPNERVERDWVIVLADRSASMTIADADENASGTPATRESQLARAINDHWDMWRDMGEQRTVLWLGFDSGAFDLPTLRDADGPSGIDLGEPAGVRTSLGASLEQALRRAAARPISGVVILSDGRSNDEPTRQIVRSLQSELTRVVTVPLGSPDPVGDLAVVEANAPLMAFVDDTVPVRVRVDRLGSQDAVASGIVQIVEKSTGIVLAQRPLPADWDDNTTYVTVPVRPKDAGERSWAVRLVPDSTDLIEQNNHTSIAIELVDRPMRVAYFDGYPRWERHFLTTLLLREGSVTSSSIMLAADRSYTQEGDQVLAAVPRSPEDWAPFDVVLIGDVRPELFGTEQLANLREHVAVRGGGLLWIAGPGFTPAAWADSPLADLVPLRLGQLQSGLSPITRYRRPVTLNRTKVAEQLGVLELSDTEGGFPSALSDPKTGWSKLQWAQRIEPEAIKPTARVLATFTQEGAQPTPAVLSMRYGAGTVVYVATDEIWRWRYGQGETMYERFWLPLIRAQGRERLARSSQSALFETSPRRAQVEQAVRVELRLLDQALVDRQFQGVAVRVRREEPAQEDEPFADVTLRLAGERSGSDRNVSQTYAATWTPDEPGRYVLEPTDPFLSALELSATLEVVSPDDELRQPETDHALLATLSEQTGGTVLPESELDDLPSLLPRRDVTITGVPDVETLWDKPIVLAMLILLLTAEWVGRKFLQLA
jgi:hypothetical protein